MSGPEQSALRADLVSLVGPARVFRHGFESGRIAEQLRFLYEIQQARRPAPPLPPPAFGEIAIRWWSDEERARFWNTAARLVTRLPGAASPPWDGFVVTDIDAARGVVTYGRPPPPDPDSITLAMALERHQRRMRDGRRRRRARRGWR